MTTTEIIQVLQAHERGEKIEVRDREGTEWVEIRYPNWNFAGYRYRVATPPKTIPLTPADVPPGSVVRPTCINESGLFWGVDTVLDPGVLVVDYNMTHMQGKISLVRWDELARSWQILRPEGVWESASKTV